MNDDVTEHKVNQHADIVLVVDDSPVSLGALCAELETDGYTVIMAFDGASALERLDLVTPDVILMDALMPGMDGFETCRRIKAVAAWSHIPVIFMTGLSETSHVVKGFEAGGVDYVVKPVRAQEVLARLATHVRNARAVRMARDAIDIGGHGVLMLDAHQRVAWHSPQAKQWLDEFVPSKSARQRLDWLADDDAHGGGTAAGGGAGAAASAVASEPRVLVAGKRTLTAFRLGSVGIGEVMWLLSVRQAGSQPASRLSTAALTPREAEVLSWISKGKTNRDIGEILGLSPRTINKHLEHVFEKLGVETRAAAAALASREMPADGD